jgi:hypothetical protein
MKTYTANYGGHEVEVQALFDYQAKVRARECFIDEYGLHPKVGEIYVVVKETCNKLEVKSEILMICISFELGDYEMINQMKKSGEYIETKFQTSKGYYTHYYRVRK